MGLHESIANDVPQIKRGQVWCRQCGSTQQVDGADCLRTGWPTCCGYTMTIDSPEEQPLSEWDLPQEWRHALGQGKLEYDDDCPI